MKTASDVDQLVASWIGQGLTKADIIIRTAEAELGWPYVWGSVGALCTPANRQAYANRGSCPADESKVIISGCQALNGSGKSCGGCTFYPDNMRVLIDDCQGFAKQVFSRVGIKLTGGGCTTMWGNAGNWAEKGTIDKMPRDKVCLVFQYNKTKNNMQHVGIHIGNGQIIECSGTVKRNSTANPRWTHYGIPKGMEGTVPTTDKPTLRRGSTGEYVTLLQTKLIQRGYDVGPTGADGKYGAKTAAAVSAFQRDNGLDADGICGPRTWNAIDAETTATYTVKIQHLTQAAAEELVKKYGGTIAKE